MEMTLNEIIQATGAKILKNETVQDKFAVSTDTRTIKQGEIYLPLKGDNFDGEDFIDKAIEAGAIGYFCTNGKWKMENEKCNLVFQVKDTLTAYLELAKFYKNKISPITVAITGSSGKTTTKEMAYCVASEKFKTHKSELNFNNEIGLCKTILSMPEDTEVLILEMGMRGLGEIELLSKYSQPDIAIIANVGTAHIGRLGSIENIAKAKCEIVKHLKDNGTLIAHNDKIIKKIINPLNLSTVRPFDLSTVKILDRSIGYSKFIYKDHEYELNIEGDYNIENSLAVIEMGLLLKMKPSEINKGLKKYSPIEKRWEVQEVKGYKIINDSYNANPESMKAMLKTVFDIYPPPILFVLGDMAELGENEITYHQEIGDFLVKHLKENKKICHCEQSEATQNINVITVGHLANEITKKLNDNGLFSKNFENNLQTSKYILDNVKTNTTIILKASRAMKFEEIIDGVAGNRCKKNCFLCYNF